MTRPPNYEMISAMSDVTAPPTASEASDPFAKAAASAAALKRLSGANAFDVAVVLGSGWLAAADAIGVPEAEISTADLTWF